jgi:hypothetical protein
LFRAGRKTAQPMPVPPWCMTMSKRPSCSATPRRQTSGLSPDLDFVMSAVKRASGG